MEGFILHVCCENIEAAEHFLNTTRDAGLKRSGIISLRSKIIVEIIDTQRIDLPIINEGKLLVSEEYLQYLLEDANEKLEETRKRIKKLTTLCHGLDGEKE